VDDWGDSLFKFTADGEQLMLIETKNNAGEYRFHQRIARIGR
jgi:hypothetical protein